ncbi:low molecular weight protein-tyrosine-phosphatase [Nocardioides sp. AX2bis]|uniref:low molecular weight protein-tyrosine-phosphatase n=1 Tax=Nocardioides sp. AX2bis TaxID=2653157 RepID=UPI0012F27F60|nr:low molecular weight protein-tyrosine-phosphatase [Nocardioides sp. AX2bis]VXB95760.1 Low molecular weight protein-tyrosine-phosphatase [Nocardioides sp. AX2bis]
MSTDPTGSQHPGPALPEPRVPGRYSVALVCLGNICRSPMAEVVLADAVDRAGLGDRVALASCGTGAWHAGDPMDRRAAATLVAHGLDPSAHRARHLDPADPSWFTHDLLLVMDAANLRDTLALGPDEPDRVRLFRSLDPVGTGADVPDPYYGGDDGFEEVLGMVRRVSDVLVTALPALLEERPG